MRVTHKLHKFERFFIFDIVAEDKAATDQRFKVS